MAYGAVRSKAVVLLLLIYCLMYFPLFVGVLCLSLFCHALLCVHSSFAIILKRKRMLAALLSLSYGCIATICINVLWLFLTVCSVSLWYFLIILTYFLKSTFLQWSVIFWIKTIEQTIRFKADKSLNQTPGADPGFLEGVHIYIFS